MRERCFVSFALFRSNVLLLIKLVPLLTQSDRQGPDMVPLRWEWDRHEALESQA